MDTFAFPDELVSQKIELLAKRNNLQIVRRQTSRNSDGKQEWEWHLQYADSTVGMKIIFMHPSYISIVWISKGEDGFPIDRYFDQHSKSFFDLKTLKRIASERTWQQEWPQILDILESHLAGDLGRIIRGEFWPKLEFRMEDYFSPEAIDRMHQDSLKRFETPDNPNPWLYIVNFFKGKSSKK